MSATSTNTATLPSTSITASGNATSNKNSSAEKSKAPKVSHGRGGAANIGSDDTVYVDGGIIREGPAGDQGDGAYSTGRGGAANIGSPRVKASKPADQEIIPETALRSDKHEVFHTGRGGEGNLHHETSRIETKDLKTKKEPKEAEETHLAGEVSSQIPSAIDASSDSDESKTKQRRSFFGRSSHGSSDAEGDPVKKAKDEEKAAKKAEHEKKFPPPTHGGLGDKLKYKVFGRLYD